MKNLLKSIKLTLVFCVFLSVCYVLSALLRRNLLIYGVGGLIAPFVGIKLIDLLVGLFL